MTDIPNGWKLSKIGDVAEIIRGVTYSKADILSASHKDAVPLLRATNLEVDSINFEDLVYVPKRVVKDQQLLKLNDIFLAASSGSLSVVGKSAQVIEANGETFGAFCSVIRPKSINPKFLAFWVQSPEVREHWSTTAKGTNINNLKPSDISETKIPIPPISEQNRIVEILEDHLSRMETALSEVKFAKVKAAHYRQSLLQAAFSGNLDCDGTRQMSNLPGSWKIQRLGDCLSKLKSGKLVERGWSPQCLNHPVRSQDTWGVLKTTAVQMGEYQPNFNKELPKTLAPKINLEVNEGDFLLTTTGPRNRCGVICYVKNTPEKLIFSGKILRFRTNNEKLLPNFLMYLLMSSEYQNMFDQLKVGTSDSSVSIGNKQVLELEIPVPPLSEQKLIVATLERDLKRIDATVAFADSIERQLAGLRRSILQASFSGQLTKEVASV